jgi:NitT/TauT family transport system permease protein
MSVEARSYVRMAGAYWLRRAFPATATFVLMLIFWQVATAAFHIPSYTLPSPTDIAAVMVDQWQSLVEHSFVTLLESVAGLGLSIAVGIPLGIVIVYSPLFERIFYPFLVASQAIPKVALAPILVAWLGFGLLPKVLIAFFIAFFPVVMNTAVGISRTPLEMIHLMRSLGASSIQILVRIQIPAASPYIFAGIKVAAAFAVVGAIVGEYIAANSGLGYLQLVADNNFQMPLLFGTLAVLSLMGIAFFYLVSLAEMLVLPVPLRQVRTDDGGGTL